MSGTPPVSSRAVAKLARVRGPASRWRGSAEFHVPRRSLGFRSESRASRRLRAAFFLVAAGALIGAVPALGALIVATSVTVAVVLSHRARPSFRARKARGRLARLATESDGDGEIVRLEGTVSASERADGVVLGTGEQVWPTRFTVTFESGEAQVEPSALCVWSGSEVRLGDRVELLGPAVAATVRSGSYRAARRTLSFEGSPERPLFVRKLGD